MEPCDRTVSYGAAMIFAGITPAELVADALVKMYAKMRVIRLRGGEGQSEGS